MRLTRRGLIQAASVLAVGAQSSGQAPPGAAAAANPDAELEAARQYLRTGAQIVRQVQLPMTVEPAIRFVPRS